MNVHQHISTNKVYAKKIGLHKNRVCIDADLCRPEQRRKLHIFFNPFCGRPPSLVFDGTCLYIVFNNLVDAVK